MSEASASKAPAGKGPNAAYRQRTKYARLAPLDHIKNLYAGANATIPNTGKPRRVFQKKDLVEAVRHVSPVKSVLAAQKRPTAERGVTTDGPVADGLDSTTRALMDLEAGVNHNARRYNDLRELGDRREAELKRLKDKLFDLEVENKALHKIEDQDTPDARRIRELEAEIDAVKDRMDNKLMQKAQYEHMMRRLRKNQVSFDAHIKAMDNALKASKKEYGEVHTLMRQLENSKQEALQGLHKYQAQLASARKQRAKELAERRQEAANARRMEEWRKQREAKRAEMAAELRGDLTAEQEQEMLRQLQRREGESEQLRQASKERARKATTLEQAFMQIRQATGVTTLDEMVAKFMGQGANKTALEDEKAEAERRLARIQEQKREAEDRFAQLKASDIGGTELSRERIAKYEAEISAARAQLKVSKAACERLEGVLVAVRQGAAGLAQRLAPFDFLDVGPAKTAGDDDSSDSNDSDTKSSRDTLENLQASERKLVAMLTAMSVASQAPGTAPGTAPATARGGASGERVPGGAAGATAGGSGGASGAGAGAGAGAHGASHASLGDTSFSLPSTLAFSASLEAEKRPWTPHVNNDPKVHHNNVRVASQRRRAAEAASARTPRSDADSGDDSDDGAGGRLESRAEIKKRARKRYQEEQRKRDLLKKREHHPSAPNKRTQQQNAISRLAHTKDFAAGMAFLIQKPDLL